MNQYQQDILALFISSLMIAIFSILFPLLIFCNGNICIEYIQNGLSRILVILILILNVCIYNIFILILDKYLKENHRKKNYQKSYSMVKAVCFVLFSDENFIQNLNKKGK